MEIGGETLHVGSTVVVDRGQSREVREITKIGTKNLYVKNGPREDAYEIATRRKLGHSTGAGSRFRTNSEVAAADHRMKLVARLNVLGVRPTDQFVGRKSLRDYPDEALEEVISILSRYANFGTEQSS